MKVIRVRRFGMVHYHAACRSCNFNAAILREESYTPNDVRTLVRQHVRKTGHQVWIESVSHAMYSLEETRTECPS